MFPEGISNGNAHAENVIRVKLAVVENVVPMRLRTNEEVSPRGVLHANAKMQKKWLLFKLVLQPPVGMLQSFTWL